MGDHPLHDEKEQVRKNDKRNMDKRLQILDERSSILNNVEVWSMTGPCILITPVFRLIEEDFKGAIQEGPICICNICWKFKFRRNVIKLKESKYQTDICNNAQLLNQIGCVKAVTILWLKIKCQCRARLNNLELCPKFGELDRLCLIELLLISQIIPFMFIIAKTKFAQHGLKWQCGLFENMFTDLKTNSDHFTKVRKWRYLISLALKHRLTEKSVVIKQQIRPVLVNAALEKLTKINPFYSYITIGNE